MRGWIKINRQGIDIMIFSSVFIILIVINLIEYRDAKKRIRTRKQYIDLSVCSKEEKLSKKARVLIIIEITVCFLTLIFGHLFIF